MVAKHDPLVGRDKVASIIQALGGGCACCVQREHLGGDDLAIEAIADEIRADGGGEQPRGVDLLTIRERHGRKGTSAKDGGGKPGEEPEESGHGEGRWGRGDSS